MNGKKVDYLPSLSVCLFQNTHGIACLARLQREEQHGAQNSLRRLFIQSSSKIV
jgi:hypothetical protein